MEKIVFIKPMDKYPGNKSLELGIPQGAEYPLDNSNLIQVHINTGQMAGTTFVSANVIVNAGYAKVINS